MEWREISCMKRGGVDADSGARVWGRDLDRPEASGRLCERLFCGKRGPRDLNWAGIALAACAGSQA
jgi:hypothetical protein